MVRMWPGGSGMCSTPHIRTTCYVPGLTGKSKRSSHGTAQWRAPANGMTLRDMNGYRVAESLSDNVPVLDLGRQYYLNASERTGDVLEFFLSDIQLT